MKAVQDRGESDGKVNRTFLFVYNLLVALAFLLRYVMVGPIYLIGLVLLDGSSCDGVSIIVAKLCNILSSDTT